MKSRKVKGTGSCASLAMETVGGSWRKRQEENGPVDAALDKVRETVLAHMEGEEAEVWLFGSRAGNRPHRRSDIDVGILPRRAVRRGLIQDLREALDDLNIPYTVDLVMLDEVSEAFRENVLRSAVPWKS